MDQIISASPGGKTHVFRHNFIYQKWDNVASANKTSQVQFIQRRGDFIFKVIPEDNITPAFEWSLMKDIPIHTSGKGFIQVPLPDRRELYGIRFEDPHQGELFYAKIEAELKNPDMTSFQGKKRRINTAEEIGTETKSTCTPTQSSVCDSASDNVLDFLDIADYLQGLEKTDLYNLGLVLGLCRQRITDLREGSTCQEFCDSIVDCWLQLVDDVEARGMTPSWRNLVTALRNPRLGQTELADRITRERIQRKRI